MRRITGLAFLALVLACGPSRTLNSVVATTLVEGYLKPYPVSGITLESLTETQPPLPKAFVAVVAFTISFEDGQKVPFKGQPIYITFNEATHAFEVNRQLSTVAQSVDGAIGLHKTGQYMKSHPYDPSPWHKH